MGFEVVVKGAGGDHERILESGLPYRMVQSVPWRQEFPQRQGAGFRLHFVCGTVVCLVGICFQIVVEQRSVLAYCFCNSVARYEKC